MLVGVSCQQYARLLDDNATSFNLTRDTELGWSLSSQFVSMYMEHNVVANVFFRDFSIKLLVASFSELFGSHKGIPDNYITCSRPNSAWLRTKLGVLRSLFYCPHRE